MDWWGSGVLDLSWSKWQTASSTKTNKHFLTSHHPKHRTPRPRLPGAPGRPFYSLPGLCTHIPSAEDSVPAWIFIPPLLDITTSWNSCLIPKSKSDTWMTPVLIPFYSWC